MQRKAEETNNYIEVLPSPITLNGGSNDYDSIDYSEINDTPEIDEVFEIPDATRTNEVAEVPGISDIAPGMADGCEVAREYPEVGEV